MTIRELITELETLAQTYGEAVRCTIYDDCTVNYGYKYNKEDLYLDCEPQYDEEMGGVIVL